jgi:tetratricopeptide (TPR) repeat protein
LRKAFKKATKFFQRAIDLDPTYAAAYAGLADSYPLLGDYGAEPPNETFPLAPAAALRALEIDDALAEAHASLAHAKFLFYWDWGAAEHEYLLAIELKPNYATAHHWYALFLAAMGKSDQAMREIKLAQDLDPLSLIVRANVGMIEYFARQYDEAIEQEQKVLEADPNFALGHTFLSMAYAVKGMHAQAIGEAEKAIARAGERPILLGLLGHTLAFAGRKDDALNILERLTARSRQSYVAPLSMALIYAGLGQKDKALELLTKGYAEHDPWLVLFLRNYHQLDDLRPDPRFQALLKRMGL